MSTSFLTPSHANSPNMTSFFTPSHVTTSLCKQVGVKLRNIVLVNNRNLNWTLDSTSCIKGGEFVISNHSLVLAGRTKSAPYVAIEFLRRALLTFTSWLSSVIPAEKIDNYYC